MKYLVIVWILASFISCQAQSTKSLNQAKTIEPSIFTHADMPEQITPIIKTDEEWAKILTDEEYYVLRQQGTERSFTGDLWDNKKEGTYICRGCGIALFSSKTKYKSGTGWPSFYEPLKAEYVSEDTDYKLGYARTEVHCARCGGHLGHVFPDGPKPTGLRYCMNSVSMDFIEDQAQLKP